MNQDVVAHPCERPGPKVRTPVGHCLARCHTAAIGICPHHGGACQLHSRLGVRGGRICDVCREPLNPVES